MEPDLPAQIPDLTDPQVAGSLLTQLHPVELAVGIVVGFLAPWLCGRLVGRKLGLIAYAAVGTMASAFAIWAIRGIGGFASQHLVLAIISGLICLMLGLLVISMRRP